MPTMPALPVLLPINQLLAAFPEVPLPSAKKTALIAAGVGAGIVAGPFLVTAAIGAAGFGSAELQQVLLLLR